MKPRELRKPTCQLIGVLAENVRYLRHFKGLSQEELANTCGLHRTYVGSVERGERNITLSTLETIARSLGVSATDLLSDFQEPR